MNLVLEYNIIENDFLQLRNSTSNKQAAEFLLIEIEFHQNKIRVMKSLSDTLGFHKTVMMQYFSVRSFKKAFTDVNRLYRDLFGFPKYDDYSNFLKALK